jgi:hypothetical protein
MDHGRLSSWESDWAKRVSSFLVPSRSTILCIFGGAGLDGGGADGKGLRSYLPFQTDGPNDAQTQNCHVRQANLIAAHVIAALELDGFHDSMMGLANVPKCLTPAAVVILAGVVNPPVLSAADLQRKSRPVRRKLLLDDWLCRHRRLCS